MTNIDPIFPSVVFEWQTTLTTQVVSRRPTTETPIELGTMGANGGFIHSIQLMPVGNIIATVFRFYKGVISGTTITYYLLFEQSIAAVNTAGAASGLDVINVSLPINQSQGTGINERRILDCPADTKYYCALGTAVVAESGVNVFVRGGQY